MFRLIAFLVIYVIACYWGWHYNTWWLYPEHVDHMSDPLWQVSLVLLGPLSNLSYLGQAHFHPAFLGFWIGETVILLLLVWLACRRSGSAGAWIFVLLTWLVSGYWYHAGIMSV